MRLFRRGGQPEDRTPEQPQQPDEAAEDVIGDEWQPGSPDAAEPDAALEEPAADASP